MPREFILRAVKHGGERVTLADETVPLHEQLATFKKLVGAFPVSEEFAEVRLDELTPNRRKVQLMTPKQAKAKAKADEEAEKDSAKTRKADAERVAQSQGAVQAAVLKEHQAKVAELNKLHDQIRAIAQPK